MGCRPSRRAVACVRVAGEGPWGLGRSNRPRTSTGDAGVRLRQRSINRRSRDEGRNEGGGGDPRDRYSAPPTDKHFPPHSCTSATYEHGCCGTSRITLRLSKNGSTLEIEKCDFQHNFKSCKHCDSGQTASEELHHLDAPLRTQSAPNLSVSLHDNKFCPPPLLSHHINRQVADSESDASPVPLRHTGRLRQLGISDKRVDSRPGSVRTATTIDVDVESLDHSRPLLSLDSGMNTFPVKASTPNSKLVAQDSGSSQTEDQYEKIHYLQKSAVSVHSENIRDDSYIAQAELVISQSPHVYDNEETDRITGNGNISPVNHKVPIDLTAHHTIISDILCDTDSDIDCPSSQSVCVSQTSQSEENEAVCCPSQREIYVNNVIHCHSSGAVGAEADYCEFDASDSTHMTDMIEDHPKDRKITCGATDYRIRMLGVQDFEITPSVIDTGAAQHYVSSTMAHVSGSQVTLVSCDDQVIPRENKNGDAVDLSDNHVMLAVDHSSDITVASGNQMVPSLKLIDSQTLGASMTGIVKRQDHHDKPTSTNGVAVEPEHQLKHLEMSPAYVHADFKNDFDDLFDDSSPGFDAS